MNAPAERLFVGVDGGGSRTRALVAGEDGGLLGSAEAGPSNAKSVGFDAASRELGRAIEEALASAGARPPAAALCVGAAGIDTDEDCARLEDWLRARALASRVRVEHDSTIALAAAFPPRGDSEPWGIVLVCGTGSVCVGSTRDGARVRVGGWGWLLGDEGSAWDVAVRALSRAAAAADGRASPTCLLDAALARWRCESMQDVAHIVYTVPSTRSSVAAFAEAVVALAECGDEGARAVVRASAEGAAAMLDAVARRVADPAAPVVFAGGLLVKSAYYRELVGSLAREPLGEPVLVDDPARGALELALRGEGRRRR